MEKKPDRRHVIGSIGAALTAGLAGCSQNDSTPTPGSTPTDTASPTESDTPTETPTESETESETDTPEQVEVVVATAENFHEDTFRDSGNINWEEVYYTPDIHGEFAATYWTENAHYDITLKKMKVGEDPPEDADVHILWEGSENYPRYDLRFPEVASDPKAAAAGKPLVALMNLDNTIESDSGGTPTVHVNAYPMGLIGKYSVRTALGRTLGEEYDTSGVMNWRFQYMPAYVNDLKIRFMSKPFRKMNKKLSRSRGFIHAGDFDKAQSKLDKAVQKKKAAMEETNRVIKDLKKHDLKQGIKAVKDAQTYLKEDIPPAVSHLQSFIDDKNSDYSRHNPSLHVLRHKYADSIAPRKEINANAFEKWVGNEGFDITAGEPFSKEKYQH